MFEVCKSNHSKAKKRPAARAWILIHVCLKSAKAILGK
jgi:hypothetical protein